LYNSTFDNSKKGVKMEELIYETSEKAINELRKSQKPPYPLYYKKVFNELLKSQGVFKDVNSKLLCEEESIDEIFLKKTEETIKYVDKTSKEIKKDSKVLAEGIDKSFDVDEIKEAVLEFNKNISAQFNELEERVNFLQQELDKAYKELLIDSLTKAYNKKALEKDLNEILKETNQKDLDLVIAVIDFDDFKNINDTYGHLVGDFALIKLVEIIKRIIANKYNIYRFGGDEFVLVLNNANLKEAEYILEKIIDKIDRTNLKYNQHLIEITISIGATGHKKCDTIDTLLARADEALYEAKKEGKNRYKIKV